MPIVNSTYRTDQAPQANGSIWVYETHTDHNGIDHTAEYLAAPGFDLDEVMTKRAKNLGAEIDRREAEEAEASRFTMNISKLEFLTRFTTAERVACRTLAKTDPIAEDFMEMLNMAQSVRPGNADLLAGLGYMESMGALGYGRATEIGS